ncbi:hypothetical protein [Streptomyces sp. NPDC088748]|uniref:hypothetical protein n=1 Tax=Streptomyces sp. NPDC088748 TaxID=3365887 RepID=UPI0037F940DA
MPWIIVAQAVADRGPETVPALIAALQTFPVPAQEETSHWMKDESAKYYLMHALMQIGPAAVAAVPTLEAISNDRKAHRDIRWKANETLTNILRATSESDDGHGRQNTRPRHSSQPHTPPDHPRTPTEGTYPNDH